MHSCRPIRTRVALLAVAMALSTAPEANASYALEDWNMETRNSLPSHMKLWLFSMLIVHVSSIFFVRRHVAARWVLGAFIVGHTWIAVFEIFQIYTVKGGLVSLGHLITWAPAIYVLYRYRHEIRLPSAYGYWACILSLYYAISLVFDVRDAGIWISSLLH